MLIRQSDIPRLTQCLWLTEMNPLSLYKAVSISCSTISGFERNTKSTYPNHSHLRFLSSLRESPQPDLLSIFTMSYKNSSKQDSFRGQDVSIPNKEDSVRLDENADPEFNPAPDGGLEAWLVAAGAACIFFSCLGFANSFGVLQEYYMSHQLRGHSADAIAWIGSVSTFIQFAAGALSGPLFDRYGAWVCSSDTDSGAILTRL